MLESVDAKAIKIANLEEQIKTLRFEIRDKEWGIQQLERELAELMGR